MSGSCASSDPRSLLRSCRLAACKLAKVEPQFASLNGDDPVAYVISMNVKRRNLTASQRAIAAAEAWPLYEVQRGRPEKGGTSTHIKTRDLLRVAFGVGEKSIQQARALTPDLAVKVKTGTQSLADAYEEHRRREGRDNATRQMLDRLRTDHADLSEQVAADTLPLPDAIAVAEEERQREQLQVERECSGLLNRLLADTEGGTEKITRPQWGSLPHTRAAVGVMLGSEQDSSDRDEREQAATRDEHPLKFMHAMIIGRSRTDLYRDLEQ